MFIRQAKPSNIFILHFTLLISTSYPHFVDNLWILGGYLVSTNFFLLIFLKNKLFSFIIKLSTMNNNCLNQKYDVK